LTVTTSTPGKLILLGEYAVLEGSPAIVAAVNKYAKITIDESPDTYFYLDALNIGFENLPFFIETDDSLKFKSKLKDDEINLLSLFSKIFSYIIKYYKSQNIIPQPCKIKIDTSDFYFENSKYKLGLGSSAAISVGLIESICKFNNLNFKNKNDLFQIALNSHFEAQGKIGSGIDIAASTNKGLGIFQKSANNYSYKHIQLPNDLYIIPVWTGASTSTSEFVSKTNKFKKNDSTGFNLIINEMKKNAEQGCAYIINNNSANFLDTVHKYYELMKKLGNNAEIPIISAVHEDIFKMINKCGGFYKPSGAGGSDIGIAITNKQQVQKNIIGELNKSPYKYIKLDITH